MKITFTHSRRFAWLAFTAALAGVWLSPSSLKSHGFEDHSNIKQVLTQELAGHPDQQVSITTVYYEPGGSTPAHIHHGPVYVYVTEGAVELQIQGGPLTTVKAGETFYEPPGSIHQVSRNASKTTPAKLVAFIIGKKDTPPTSPLKK
jgi:quercetin dioxygenase-like cupin family protein